MSKPKSNYMPPDDLPTVGGSYTRAKPGAEPVRVPLHASSKTLGTVLADLARRDVIATATADTKTSAAFPTKSARK